MTDTPAEDIYASAGVFGLFYHASLPRAVLKVSAGAEKIPHSVAFFGAKNSTSARLFALLTPQSA